jgi:hypothetical protein
VSSIVRREFRQFRNTVKQNVQRVRAPIAIASVSLLFVLVVVLAAYRYYYPYGMRPACLPVFLGALRSYALEHDGFFPNLRAATKNAGPNAALMGDPMLSLPLLLPPLGPDRVEGSALTMAAAASLG